MRKVSQQDGQVEWFKKKLNGYPPKPEGWYTINEIAEMTGNGTKLVSERLKKMAKDGEIEEMKCLINGHICNAYRKKN